jgi:hypothetical protein
VLVREDVLRKLELDLKYQQEDDLEGSSKKNGVLASNQVKGSAKRGHSLSGTANLQAIQKLPACDPEKLSKLLQKKRAQSFRKLENVFYAREAFLSCS